MPSRSEQHDAPDDPAAHLRFQVVVPAHQAMATLPACLDALIATGFAADDILVVDDGSSDGSGAIAAAHGTRVIRNDVALGPSLARNIGVAALGGAPYDALSLDGAPHDAPPLDGVPRDAPPLGGAGDACVGRHGPDSPANSPTESPAAGTARAGPGAAAPVAAGPASRDGSVPTRSVPTHSVPTQSVIVFVDADVVVATDMRARVAASFAADPDLSAVFGAYDAAPGGSVLSRYRNLLHHLTHTKAAGPATTFWTGIGAVRHRAYVDLGGLDPAWEKLEDVEFGLRLTASGGRIALDPAIRGRHLKEWTPRSMFVTDLKGRALPWTRLLLAGRAEAGNLNTAPAHQVSAASVALAAVSVVAALAWPPALWGLAVALAAFLGANAGLLRDMARIDGVGFALRILPWHGLHYVAAIAGAGWAVAERLTRKA